MPVMMRTRHFYSTNLVPNLLDAGLILGLRPANERRRYFVTTFPIRSAQA